MIWFWLLLSNLATAMAFYTFGAFVGHGKAIDECIDIIRGTRKKGLIGDEGQAERSAAGGADD